MICEGPCAVCCIDFRFSSAGKAGSDMVAEIKSESNPVVEGGIIWDLPCDEGVCHDYSFVSIGMSLAVQELKVLGHGADAALRWQPAQRASSLPGSLGLQFQLQPCRVTLK